MEPASLRKVEHALPQWPDQIMPEQPAHIQKVLFADVMHIVASRNSNWQSLQPELWSNTLKGLDS